MIMSEVDFDYMCRTLFLGDVKCTEEPRVDIDGVKLMKTASGKEAVLLEDAVQIKLIGSMSDSRFLKYVGQFAILYDSNDDVEFVDTLRLQPINLKQVSALRWDHTGNSSIVNCQSKGNSGYSDKIKNPDAPSNICYRVEKSGKHCFNIEPTCPYLDSKKNKSLSCKCGMSYDIYFFDLDRKIPLLYKISSSLAAVEFFKFLDNTVKKRPLDRLRGISTSNKILVLGTGVGGSKTKIIIPSFKIEFVPEDLKGVSDEYHNIIAWYKENLDRPGIVATYVEGAGSDYKDTINTEKEINLAGSDYKDTINTENETNLAGSEYRDDVPF